MDQKLEMDQKSNMTILNKHFNIKAEVKDFNRDIKEKSTAVKEKKSPEIKFRAWTWTWNVPEFSKELEETLTAINYTYIVYGRETAPTTGQKHYQGYFYLKNPRTLSSMVKEFKGAHFEPSKGTAAQNDKYCKKGEDWVVLGTIPNQGRRTDLDTVKADLLEGKITADEAIIETSVDAAQKYGRVFDRYEGIYLKQKTRTEPPTVLWFYGKTGTGKSREAARIGDGKAYEWAFNDRDWQDNYKHQSVTILDDFRGQMPYNNLLRLLDRYGYDMSRRGVCPLKMTSETIIITSSLRPEECYKSLMHNDGIAQLLRRITEIREFV